MSSTVNVQAQFDKAVAIVKSLPPDGPVKPTQDQQLLVSHDPFDEIRQHRGIQATAWKLFRCDMYSSASLLIPGSSFTDTSSKRTRGTVQVLLQVPLSLLYGFHADKPLPFLPSTMTT